jgi:translocation and assembly module TamA
MSVYSSVPLSKEKFLLHLAGGLALVMGAWGVANADVPYDLTLKPTGDVALDGALEAASQLSALKDRPPDSEATLRSRAADDRTRLNAVAHAFGYYDDEIETAIDVKAKPVKVTVTVKLGPRYLLASVAIVAAGDKPLPAGAPVVAPADVGLEIGKPALSAPVAAANDKIAHAFRAKGFPFARVIERKAIVDHGAQQMRVTYAVDPGPSAIFGHTRFSGLKTVEQDYMERRLRWQTGAPYDVTEVDKTRDALVATNLFSTVTVTPEKSDDPDAVQPVTTPMAVDVAERASRTVAVGASYASTEGVSANATWEHRNLFGEGEDLKLGLLIGQEESAATANFRRPDILGADWDLVNKLTIDKVDANAYTSKGGSILGGLEYKGIDKVVFGAGLELEHANISDYELRQRYTLVGIPLYAKRDESDDLLNPTKGDREGITITPYSDPARTELTFVSARINGSYYLRLGDGDQYVLAAMGALGSTFGVDLANLPKDKRFYVGGGGSVRGYGFQRAGPIGIHDEPIGGLSSAEASLELRYKLTETIGIVPFVEAGNVYDTSIPDLSKRLFIGAGIGARYYTGLGPIRLDLATPLRQREGDAPLQIYVSLGQAF